ncbi:MAG: hypothetical protein RIS35_50 [Pseudomonadota bacterium]|jgi:CRP-like cAMP-binding protein
MPAPTIETRHYLATLPLFHGLEPEVVDRIAPNVGELKALKGQIVFRRGDPCTGFHAVVYGQVKLAVEPRRGVEKVIEQVRAGQSFGRSIMFTDLTYPIYAQALVDTLLLHIPRDAIRDEIRRTPQLATRMTTGLSLKSHGLATEVEAYALRAGVQRVVGYLLRRAVPAGTADSASGEGPARVLLDISRNLLASWLNLTAEQFARILDDLEREDLIRVCGSEIRILDPERLKALLPH